MKKIIFLLPILFLLSCASTTYIRTMPQGVKVTENGALRGVTPYMHFDRGVEMTGRTFTLKKEGYKDKTITIEKNEFYIHRLIIPPILGWLWLFGYPYEYYFELEKNEQPIQGTGSTLPNQVKITKPNAPASSNSETQSNNTEFLQSLNNLKELRRLKDEGILTDEEYEQKKKMIMETIDQ